jgi:hypothetical protein
MQEELLLPSPKLESRKQKKLATFFLVDFNLDIFVITGGSLGSVLEVNFNTVHIIYKIHFQVKILISILIDIYIFFLLQGAASLAVALTAFVAVQSYPLQGGFGGYVGNHGSQLGKETVDYHVSSNSRTAPFRNN